MHFCAHTICSEGKIPLTFINVGCMVKDNNEKAQITGNDAAEERQEKPKQTRTRSTQPKKNHSRTR